MIYRGLIITASVVAAAQVVLGAETPLTFDLGVPGSVIEYDGRRPLFELHTSLDRKDPRDRVLGPGDFGEVSSTTIGLAPTITYAHPPAPWPTDLRVTVHFTSETDEIEARLSIESPGGVEIRRVNFPIIDVVPTYPFDTLLMSHPMGDAMHYPNRVIGARMGGEAVYRYPATLSMQYMVLFNGGRSYYLSAYSTGDETFEHSAKTLDNGMRLSCVWYPFLDDGRWESPPCGLSVLPGGWHAAADLYRRRMTKVFQPPPLPAWMHESFHGWMQVSFKGAQTNPPFRFTDIPALYDKVEDLGLNVLHIFSWGQGGFDNNYPLRFPSPNNGTPEELRAAMDEVRSRGGHVVLYTNGRLIDPDTPFYAEGGGHRAIAVTEDWKPYVETYAGNTFYVACPSTAPFQDALFDNFRRIVLDYHANAAQIDQVGVTPGVFCFNPNHPHPAPSRNWLAATDHMLERIHTFYREKDPDFFVWCEGTNERFGRWYEVHQSHGEEGWWTPGDSLPEQFRYTYPDYLLTGISDNIQMMCHTHGQGKPFDFNLRRLSDPDWVRLLKALVRVRKAEPAYFLRGRFRDTVGVEATGEHIRCWRIDRDEGPGTLVNVWARGRDLASRAEASVRLPEPDWPARAVYPDDLTLTCDGTWIRMKWTGPIATLASEPER
jgi:hypothetical protein